MSASALLAAWILSAIVGAPALAVPQDDGLTDYERARLLEDEASQLANEGDEQKAYLTFLEAAKNYERAGRQPGETIPGDFFCYVYAAQVCSRVGRNDEAIALLDRAVERLPSADEAETADERNRILQSRTYCHTLAGHSWTTIGSYEEAARELQTAIELNEGHSEEFVTMNRVDLGIVYSKAGRYGDAMRELDAAIESCRAHANEVWGKEQMRLATINRTQVLEKTGEYEVAREIYEKLLEEPDLPSFVEAEIEASLARIYLFALHNAELALAHSERAVELTDDDSEPGRRSNALLHCGAALLEMGSEDEARTTLEQALALARQGDADQTEVLFDLVFLGRCLHRIGALDEAANRFEEAIAVADEIGSREGRWSARSGHAHVLAERGDRAGALERFEQALAIIEDVRARQVPDPSRARFFGTQQQVYASYVETLLGSQPSSDAVARAFHVVQRARARSLLDHLDAAPRTLAEVQSTLLGERQAVIEFVLTEDRLLAFLVTRRAAEVLTLMESADGSVLSQELARLVTHARKACTEVEPKQEQHDALHRLSRELTTPIRERLGPTMTHWILVPDAALATLPFAALRDGPDTPRLIEHASLGYAPSTSTIGAVRSRPVPDSEPLPAFVAFGEPLLPPPGAQGAESNRPQSAASLLVDRYALRALPGSREELRLCADRIDGQAELRLGKDATATEFRSVAPRGSRVLHLATHTVIDRRRPEASAVLLTPGDDRYEAGVLRSGDVASMRIPARLVTLSSCQSGEGSWIRGEGVIGLARSFLLAGAESVLATLWRVEDASSPHFMEQVYHHLSMGHGRAEALRQAQIAFLENPATSHPRHWAPYLVIGETTGPVFDTPMLSKRLWLPAIAGAGVAVAILAAFAAYRSSRRS